MRVCFFGTLGSSITCSPVEKLAHSKYGNDQDIDEMFKQFNKSAKPIFHKADDPSYVKFGSMRDKDPKYGIRNGQLTLSGYVHGFEILKLVRSASN